MRATMLAIAALAIAGCSGGGVQCPAGAPPELYALPDRLTEYVEPEDYAAERDVLEGRHTGFAAEWDAHRSAWEGCRTAVE